MTLLEAPVDLDCRIAALQGAPGLAKQDILTRFAARLRREGLRVAGVIEESDCSRVGGCKNLGVRDLVSGRRFSISQPLGVGSTACNLDPVGLACACALVEQAIDQGADVVVLSKFGKAEAERGGLADAFRAAMFAGIPLVTTVAPVVADDWSRFAGPLATYIDAADNVLDAWWSRTAGLQMH